MRKQNDAVKLEKNNNRFFTENLKKLEDIDIKTTDKELVERNGYTNWDVSWDTGWSKSF